MSRVGVVFGSAGQGEDDGQACGGRQSSSRARQLIAHTKIGFLNGHAAQGSGHCLGDRTKVSCQANGPFPHGVFWMGQCALDQGLIPTPAEVQSPERLEGELTTTLEERLGQTRD